MIDLTAIERPNREGDGQPKVARRVDFARIAKPSNTRPKKPGIPPRKIASGSSRSNPNKHAYRIGSEALQSCRVQPPTATKVASGVFYYGFRYYVPELGRWVNRDPIEEEDGVNLYSFIHNDGINYADRYGLKPFRLHPDGNLVDPCHEIVPCPDCELGLRICMILAKASYQKRRKAAEDDYRAERDRISKRTDSLKDGCLSVVAGIACRAAIEELASGFHHANSVRKGTRESSASTSLAQDKADCRTLFRSCQLQRLADQIAGNCI